MDPASDERIDEALLLLMRAPRSFTREDVVDRRSSQFGQSINDAIESQDLEFFKEVVAKFKGEGVAEFDDRRGFIFTNYHYAEDEGMCCPSYWALNYFRPGANGWTHSMRTVPSNPNKDIYDEEPYKLFKKVEIVATYNYARAKSND